MTTSKKKFRVFLRPPSSWNDTRSSTVVVTNGYLNRVLDFETILTRGGILNYPSKFFKELIALDD